MAAMEALVVGVQEATVTASVVAGSCDLKEAAGKLEIEVLGGAGLVAKDTGFMRSGKSDPYVKVQVGGTLIGKTKVVKKSLEPRWEASFATETAAGPSSKWIKLSIFDYDATSRDDPMGQVEIDVAEWYGSEASGTRVQKRVPVSADSACPNATGTLDVAIRFTPRTVLALDKGMAFDIDPQLSSDKHRRLLLALGWTETGLGSTTDLDASCVFFDRRGAVVDALYFGKTACFAGAANHSGDARTGDTAIDRLAPDERIDVCLAALPEKVASILIIITAYEDKTSFKTMDSGFCGIWDPVLGELARFEFDPRGPHTGLVVGRLARSTTRTSSLEPHGWVFSAVGDVADGPRDYGTWLPELKGYLRDVSPDVRVGDPRDRVAVMRKGQIIQLADYASVVPLTNVAMGLSWDITHGVNIDLDASAILLDASLHPVEIISFSHKTAKDRSVIHSGDDLTGEGEGDDEIITVHLTRLNPRVAHIGFVVCSYSGQTFCNVDNTACHLFVPPAHGAKPGDPTSTNDDLAYFRLDSRTYDRTALLMTVLTRSPDNDWTMKACGIGFTGKIAQDCVDELQEFLRTGTIVR